MGLTANLFLPAVFATGKLSLLVVRSLRKIENSPLAQTSQFFCFFPPYSVICGCCYDHAGPEKDLLLYFSQVE
ncbi:MAG: hypothetical protein HYW34_00385 [Candidatus Brennerbacteria bacterium]|nr:hypothetical protein [Candidatus Brennerbacteria bacterium]